MKKIGLPINILLLLIVIPVLVTQVMAKEKRNYQAVSLEETSYEEISFRNEAQDIDLGGMLFLPEGEGSYPAVVFIHGSGSSRRDNRWYLTMTQYLQANGIAVLLPDKRGSEKSGGSWHSASFEDLSTDAVAAVDFLKTRDDLPITQIGIIGMSQGGFIAPMLASLSPDVAFVVDVVGAAVPVKEQLLFEENNNLREMGFLPGISNLIAYPAAWSIREVRQKDFWDAVGHYDPLPYWQEMEIDGLALFGEIDPNVPSIKSAELLRSLGKDNITVKVYGGSAHALQDPVDQGNRYIREDALHDIVTFVKRATATS